MKDDGGLDPVAFRARVVELAPAEFVRFDPDAWADEIVLLTAGEIELECQRGERRRFGAGSILCLSPLPLAVVRSVGAEPARLLAVSRRRPAGLSSSG